MKARRRRSGDKRVRFTSNQLVFERGASELGVAERTGENRRKIDQNVQGPSNRWFFLRPPNLRILYQRSQYNQFKTQIRQLQRKDFLARSANTQLAVRSQSTSTSSELLRAPRLTVVCRQVSSRLRFHSRSGNFKKMRNIQ